MQLLNAPPQDEKELRIEELEERLADALRDAENARSELATQKRALARIGRFLEPLHRGLKEFYGELESFGPNNAQVQTEQQPGGPLDGSRYSPWKQKYPGQTAAAIDILVKYESGLSRKQLAGFLKIDPGSGSMSQIIFKLNKADLIFKDGNLIRLKRV